MSDAPAPPARPMKFPYTFTAKVAQFPFKFYYKNNFIFRYYIFGIVASIPIFSSISKLANSPENVQKWDEIRRKERQGHH